MKLDTKRLGSGIDGAPISSMCRKPYAPKAESKLVPIPGIEAANVSLAHSQIVMKYQLAYVVFPGNRHVLG